MKAPVDMAPPRELLEIEAGIAATAVAASVEASRAFATFEREIAAQERARRSFEEHNARARAAVEVFHYWAELAETAGQEAIVLRERREAKLARLRDRDRARLGDEASAQRWDEQPLRRSA
jgi:hypothetical protein